jgi:Hint domain
MDRSMTPRSLRPLALAAVLALAASCAGSSSTTGTGSPSPGPTSSASGSPLSIEALKLEVLDAVGGHLAYCDPDQFPIAHGTPLEAARMRLPTIQADQAAYQAILQHQHLEAGQPLTDAQVVAVNEDYKQMQAIDLQPSTGADSSGGYSFEVVVPPGTLPPSADNPTYERVGGTVALDGVVSIQDRTDAQRPNCPICLTEGTLIATPTGPVAVQDLRVGMRVWTTDRRGRRIVGVIEATGHMAAPLGHEVVRLRLADGREVTVSPGHRTADGRTVGELWTSDRYDGSVVVSATLAPYAGFTYDLLPSGPTGTYVANGILLGTTLSS